MKSIVVSTSPFFKKIGANLNECIKPTIIQSAVHILRQNPFPSREIWPELFLGCHFSTVKGPVITSSTWNILANGRDCLFFILTSAVHMAKLCVCVCVWP